MSIFPIELQLHKSREKISWPLLNPPTPYIATLLSSIVTLLAENRNRKSKKKVNQKITFVYSKSKVVTKITSHGALYNITY